MYTAGMAMLIFTSDVAVNPLDRMSLAFPSRE